MPGDGSIRILVVEDSPEDAHLVLQALSKGEDQAFDPVFTDCLSSGLEHLADGGIDAVLLDLGLPDSDGLTSLVRVRQLSPRVPVVVLTGFGNGDRAREAIRLGAQDYVLKGSIGFELLSRSVAYAVERSRAVKDLRDLNELLERAVKKRTAEINATRASFNSIVERSADAILVVDLQGTTRYANPAAAELFGWPVEKLVGEQFGLPVVPNDLVEVEVRRENGHCVTAELRWAESEWNGEPAYVTTLRNVTERKHLQAQLIQADRMASVGTLAAGVAHEINNPLSYLLYNLQSLVEDLPHLGQAPLDDMVARVSEAAEGATRIRDIVRDMKTFSSLEEDRREPVRLDEVIETAATMCHNEIRYRARLVKEYGDIPAVLANAGRLSQVFLNLLLNAAQAIEEGDVDNSEIRVRTWTDGKDVFAAVEDTGCGIPRENIGKLFTPFFTTKPPGVGSGLGLFTCHNFIRSYGGRIEVESEAGAGSRFIVALPMPSGEHEPDPAPETPDEAASEQTVIRGRILIVDDEPMIGSSLRRILRRDHDVSVATSGMQGKEILERDPSFDLILCDLMMPDFSGMDLYDWLEESNPKLARKIVFVTGGAFTPVAKQFLRRADNLRLEKPIDPKDLKALIADLLCRAGDGGGSRDKE